MKTGLTWRHLKALNQLYLTGRTDASITDNDYVRNVLMAQRRLIKHKAGNLKILEATRGYHSFFEQTYKASYTQYELFFQRYDLESDAKKRYTEDDIRSLIFIANQRETLLENLTTIKTFSGEVFKGKGGKYLENRPGLKKAVCQLLGIADFPDKDPKNLQYRFIVDCINPQCIILCENLDRLKIPWEAQDARAELWYVGGNNIGIIDGIDPGKFVLPIYYCCDWDYHGLGIYSNIKEKLKTKGQDLRLLIPDNYDVSLPIDSPHHNSRWNFNKTLSGLKQEDFSDKAIHLIHRLIKDDRWIEEESLRLTGVLAEWIK